MKKAGLISSFIFILLIFVSSPALAGPKLKYDFDYLFKWTASAMKIEIDNRPEPKLVMMKTYEFQATYEKNNDKKAAEIIIDKDGNEIKLIILAFYWHREKTICIDSQAESQVTLEEIVVHELSHYFQYSYRPEVFEDRSCLDGPRPDQNCLWQRQANALESKFRLDHGLLIRDDNLENLMFYLDNFK